MNRKLLAVICFISAVVLAVASNGIYCGMVLIVIGIVIAWKIK
jgi:membrane protein YqaA with SNARE-associated domain